MSNSMRHTVGALIGVGAVPVSLAALSFLVPNIHQMVNRFEATSSLALLGALLLLALLLGLTATSRLSPLAALIPGLVLTMAGLLPAVPQLYSQVLGMFPAGLYLDPPVAIVAGGMLVAAAFPASQWRSTQPAVPPTAAPAGFPAGHSGGYPAPQATYPASGPQPGMGIRPATPGYSASPAGAPPAGGPPWAGADQPSGPYPTAARHPGAHEPHLYGTGPLPQVDPNAPDPRYGTGP